MTTREVASRVGLFLALVALALLAFPNVAVYDGTAEPGDVWQSDDVVAPFDFSIRLPDDEIEGRRDSVLRSESPVFRARPEALAQTLARLDSVDARLDSTFAAYVEWSETRARLQQAVQAPAEAGAAPDLAALRAALRRDSVRYADAAGVALAQPEPAPVGRSCWRRPTASRRARGPGRRWTTDCWARPAASPGSCSDGASWTSPSTRSARRPCSCRTSTSGASSSSAGATWSASTKRSSLTRRSLFAAFPGRPDTVGIGACAVRLGARPVARLRRRRDPAQAGPDAPVGAADAGAGAREPDHHPPLRRGDARSGSRCSSRSTTPSASGAATARGSRPSSAARSWCSRRIALFFLYTYLLRPAIFADLRQFTLACLILAAVIAGFLIAGAFGGAAAYAVPVALASILLTIVFDSRVGSFATLTLALARRARLRVRLPLHVRDAHRRRAGRVLGPRRQEPEPDAWRRPGSCSWPTCSS